MVTLYVLLTLAAGFALVAWADDGESGGSGGSQSGSPEEEFTNAEDFVSAEEYRSTVVDEIDALVADGILTAEQGAALLKAVQFRDGPMNVSTIGGSDIVLGGSFDDQIQTGDDSDFVVGGEGDDFVRLGDDDDLYGWDYRLEGGDLRAGAVPPEGPPDTAGETRSEGGDDEVYGNEGNDVISDGIGSNTLYGRQGRDYINAVDEEEELTPDYVNGGFGGDTIIVDEGDVVSTGDGSDWVTIDLYAGVGEDFHPVVIDDFDPTRDIIELEGFEDLLAPGGVSSVTTEDLDDLSAALILVGGVPVAEVYGGAGLTFLEVVQSSA